MQYDKEYSEIVVLCGSNRVKDSQDGKRAVASFSYPKGIVMDEDGHMYIVDNTTCRVSRLTMPMRYLVKVWKCDVYYFQALTDLFQTKSLADFSLYYNDREIKVHKAVLESRCSKLVTHPKVTSDTNESACFLRFLQYLYSDDVQLIEPANMDELLVFLTYVKDWG